MFSDLFFFYIEQEKTCLARLGNKFTSPPQKKSHPVPHSYKMVSALCDINHFIFHVNETCGWMLALGLIN